MPLSPQLSQEELERMLVEAEAEVSTLRKIYVATRTMAMSATLKKRDFHYCQQSILGEEDEDLNVATIGEQDQAQAALRRAREDLIQAKRIAFIIRRALGGKGNR
jgi:C4-dicarboxylate-specific signal transduction histidine kinase